MYLCSFGLAGTSPAKAKDAEFLPVHILPLLFGAYWKGLVRLQYCIVMFNFIKTQTDFKLLMRLDSDENKYYTDSQ